MHLGKVTGSIVCTRHYQGMEGLKLMLVQPVDECLKPCGPTVVAVDQVSAGTGDLIHYTLGREASLACGRQDLPIDACITGIVDRVDVDDMPKEVRIQ